MSVTDEIRARLTAAFRPNSLTIWDESEKHIGHAGYQDGGQSHFKVDMTAPEFTGMNRLGRHRAVHAALGPDLIGRIHALALHLQAPGDPSR